MRSTAIFFLVVLLLSHCREDAEPSKPLTDTQTKIVSEINQYTLPITGSSPSLADDDLKWLDAFADAKIVGLGEATHGTKEFFEMKHRIFRYFVTAHGFRAIALESDFAEGLIFEDYVQGRNTSDLHTLMDTKMGLWIDQTLELQAMLEWMKVYNAGKSESGRIHFFGLDCQFNKYNADFLAERIAPFDADLSQYVRDQTVDYKKLNTNGDITNHNSITTNVTTLYDKITDAKPTLIAKGMTVYDYEIARQLARNIVQVNDLIYAASAGNGNQVRDEYMAENALWLTNILGTDQHICIWAHNAHIASDGMYWRNLGYNLKSSLGDRYRRVGFTFSRGSFNAIQNKTLKAWSITQAPWEKSTNFLFANAEHKKFILRIEDVAGSGVLSNWLSNSKGLLQIGALFQNADSSYDPVALRDCYDAIIYFDETNNSTIF